MVEHRARGLVYIGAIDFYDATVPGGAAAVAERLEPETRAFFAQIFLGSTMYDLMPILKISAAAAQLLGLPQLELVRRNSVWLAERDLRGVYRLFVRALPPEQVALRLPKLALKYFDFGEASTRMQGPRHCKAEMRGIPQPLLPWMSMCVQGFVPAALSIAGARNVRVHELQGDEPGAAATVLKFEISWSAA